jgi:hypothetical protein
MKTTIELPDQLMEEVKNLAQREQRKLDDLVAELVRAGINNRSQASDPAQDNGELSSAQQRAAAEQWLIDWIKLGEETLRDAPPSPTATEILAADRNRLERPE